MGVERGSQRAGLAPTENGWRRRAALISTRGRWLGWAATTALLVLIGLPPFYAAAVAGLPWLLLPNPPS